MLLTLNELKEKVDELHGKLKGDATIMDYDDCDFGISDIYYDDKDDRIYVKIEEKD